MSANRNQILRSISAAAQSMGISDRNQIDLIAKDIIQRIEEQAQALPGMETFVKENGAKLKKTPTVSEIQTMVKDVLVEREKKHEMDQAGWTQPTSLLESKENEPTMTTTSQPNLQTANGMCLSPNALHVLEKRYLAKDSTGKPVETPAELFWRVARTVAAAESNYGSAEDSNTRVKAAEERFYGMMAGLEFLPNSPTLMNAGRELGQLSACFVLPVEDSMESIFDAVKYTALIHKSGGGTGFSFSRLRPESDRVGSTGGVASGPVSFIRAFDVATDVIKQGGMRRGANMGILRVDHPDIKKFIKAKEDLTSLTNFNLSVAVTRDFMEAVKKGSEYNLINPHNNEPSAKENARAVFDMIVDSAWRTGDPGIIFIDRINRDNPTPQLGQIESTNPCGEQPLLPYESCNLGSINLVAMLKETSSVAISKGGSAVAKLKDSNGRWLLDYVKLAKTVRTAVRFLDNVIDVNQFPLPQIAARTRETRKIGLGVMGFADALLRLGIAYNSEKALATAEEIMHLIDTEALQASQELAAERGVFPAYAGSIYDVPGGPKVRNAARTTIAPTGTLSIIAGCSSGIEPLFALSFTKNILDGARLVEVNPYFAETARSRGFYSDEMMQKLADGVHLKEIEGVPDDIRDVFVTAHEIAPEWHIRMQSAFQKYTNNAVSKTVNFPASATREDVASVYMMAYEQDLKGITIYRDGSRQGQVLTTGTERKTEAVPAKTEPVFRTPRERTRVTTGFTEKVTTGCGSLYITVNSDERGICEVFSHLGKAGGCAVAQLEATCRLISISLRSGVDLDSIVKQLRGIRCPSPAWQDGKSILSCGDAIASVLERFTEAGKGRNGSSGNGHEKSGSPEFAAAKNTAGQCPECASILVYEEGCFKCPGCGYTKC